MGATLWINCETVSRSTIELFLKKKNVFVLFRREAVKSIPGNELGQKNQEKNPKKYPIVK